MYDDSKVSKEGRQCCAGQDILDAKRVSEHLNINHKILFYQKKFKEEVIDSFIDSYVAGETPIPCVQCNQTVKFRDLFKYAKELNAACVELHTGTNFKVMAKQICIELRIKIEIKVTFYLAHSRTTRLSKISTWRD